MINRMCRLSNGSPEILHILVLLWALFIGLKADYLLMVSFKYLAVILRFARRSSIFLCLSLSSVFIIAACLLSNTITDTYTHISLYMATQLIQQRFKQRFGLNGEDGDSSYSLRCCILTFRFWLACFSCCSLVVAFWALRTWKTRSSSCTCCRSEENLPSSTSTSLSSSLQSQDIEWEGCRQNKKLNMLTDGEYYGLERSLSCVGF